MTVQWHLKLFFVSLKLIWIICIIAGTGIGELIRLFWANARTSVKINFFKSPSGPWNLGRPKKAKRLAMFTFFLRP